MQLNESSKSSNTGVYFVPYEEFYVPELREKVDLKKDFVSWTVRVSGSSVVQLFALRSLIICYCHDTTNITVIIKLLMNCYSGHILQ